MIQMSELGIKIVFLYNPRYILMQKEFIRAYEIMDFLEYVIYSL